MTYTWAALLGVLGAAGVDLALLRTALLRRRAFWTAYAIVLFFQLLVNGTLTGLRIVRYDADTIIGWRVAYAPVEDLLFGFALVLTTLSLWVAAGRRAARRASPATRPAPPTPAAPGRRGRGR
jgi:lycopene cyclase domain-containing protein